MQILDLKDSPEHLETVARWHHDEWSHHNPSKTFDERLEEYQEFLNEDLVPTMLVAIEDGEAIGTSAVLECDMDGQEHLTPWLASVYVPKAHRRKGLGEKLVKAIMDTCAEHQVPKMYLYTPASEKWYAQMGWKVMERFDFHGDHVSLMDIEF